MRIISRSSLAKFWEKYPDSEQPLKAWYDEAKNAAWKTPNDLKRQFHNVSLISGKRVVFNIKGNDYRLITDMEFNIGLIFIVWIGTHKQYDIIDARKIKYDKTN